MPRRPLLALVLLLAAAGPAAADTLVTIASREEATGRPPREATVTLWIGDDAVARDDGRSTAILRGDRLVLVDHQSESYNVLPLPVDVESLLPAGMREAAGRMMEMMAMEAEIDSTDERREVGGRDARLHRVELTNAMGMAVTMDLWLSEEVEIPVERIEALARALGAVQPGGGEWVERIAALPGYPVLQETRLAVGDDVLTSREELLSIEEKPAPAGTYAPPAGYEERPFQPLPPGGPPR